MLNSILSYLGKEANVFLFVMLTLTLLFHMRFSSSIARKSLPVLVALAILWSLLGLALGLFGHNDNFISSYDFNNVPFIHILQSLSPETDIFLGVIAAFTLLFHIRFSSSTAHMAPAVLTTLGILGTFVGIALGLLDFNVNDVQKSVPSLIDGIKTAVWASAWGIFCALTVKLRQILFGTSDAYEDSENIGVTMDDLANKLSSIERALVGNSHTDLLTQFEMAHAENKAYLEKLHKTLDTLCSRMAGGQSEATVRAVKKVSDEF